MNGVWTRPAAYLACLLFGLPGLATAETLADAWRMAVEANSTLGAARSEREAADADHVAAKRLRWPVLDVVGSYTQFQDAPVLDLTTPLGQLQAPIWKSDAYVMAGADVSIPLWTSGRLSGAIGAAAAGARGAAALEARTAADLKLAVAEAYIGVFRARRALRVAESNVASLRAHADDVQVMYDKEAVPHSDLLAAQVALADATQQRLRAANALRLAMATYNRSVGQPLDRSADLVDPSPAGAETSGAAIDELTAQAFRRRPELEAIAAQEEGMQQAVRSERAQGLPQIVLRAGYSHLDNVVLDRQDFATVGVGFQWRLFDSGQIQARTSALRSRARAAEQHLADLRSMVALEVETAVLNREEATARVTVATGAVTQADENLRITRELYTAGLGTNTQVLDAEALRVTAMNNRDNAMFDLLVAGYRVTRAIGEL